LVAKSEAQAARNWDVFYKNNETRFFKDRHWTQREWGEDLGIGKGKQLEPVLLEVGCGVGNMLYPLLERYPNLKCHACDFSKRAVDFVKSHPSYTPERVHAFVYDLTSTSPPSLVELVMSVGSVSSPPPPASIPTIPPPTTISMIFVLSAIPPQLHEQVLRSMVACLRASSASASADHTPTPTILLRDYASGDLAQVRFDSKDAALPSYREPTRLSPAAPYYRRGADNTLAYFFDVDQLQRLARRCGLVGEAKVVERSSENRKTGVVLRRRFIQARW
ncbi:S-adenosyl-L-methionine-dependent methyltransferase, partial [Tilletiaria anomala UBC 951]